MTATTLENDPLLGRPKGRRISFTSVGLCAGTFPKEAKVCEPTINVALYFETCPSVHALEKVAKKITECEKMTVYFVYLVFIFDSCF